MIFWVLRISGVLSLALSVEREYYLIQLEKTWLKARAYCKANYADLATIDGDEDVTKLQYEAKYHHFNSTAWVGLYNDINSWHWSYKNLPLGSWTQWDKNQPDNIGSRDCGVMNVEGFWSDADCSNNLPFMCYDAKYTDNAKFIFISTNGTWPYAQSYCRHRYTDLASATDGSNNTDIMTKISGSSVSWIGLFRDSWKWSDQTKLSQINWMPGEPDNAKGDENCGCTYNGLMKTAKCSNTYPFFCYSVITGKTQVMRVKVQSEQGVNDPAVKAAILVKIQQQLKVAGMTDIVTLKWREQSDGTVFHEE